MEQFYLSFRIPEALTEARWVELVTAFAGGPVTTTYGEQSGNPYDQYFRSVGIAGRRGDVPFEVGLTEVSSMSSGPGTLMTNGNLLFTAASWAERNAFWEEFAKALLPIVATKT